MNTGMPSDELFILALPPVIKGFGMHDKKWKVKWDDKMFKHLVLDQQKKDLIEATIQVHMHKKMTSDIMEGKGNGLILLLHGGPGTGKTLTAESIAELVRKPLYRVTCGDIGTNPESVEEYLNSALHVGNTWQAVVLLDESDIFLEEREKFDLQRNALVSVFLRVLEYYDGILILTSNRVGTFDEAFKSRVQLALHYPPLDTKGREKIWNNFIKMLKHPRSSEKSPQTGDAIYPEEVDIEDLQDNLNLLGSQNLNGRQIRNALTTARQLAMFRRQPLGFRHLEQTIGAIVDFEGYIQETRGQSEASLAREGGRRAE
ncbi:P-loop containing nucleoside triphosphate hydrolase protein [Plectosphaerella plurivora]|uniref:P-loop containing nucleoside triphosphate hydrolase protein n=1 Tax=Plectosphaerella plurivora TaxID=936078 RepID=A0A9P8VFM8_9PEZI|nr:P-loop containing nucleoside triphosphate hydrolase protein [Plectosphaerella plurivora]